MSGEQTPVLDPAVNKLVRDIRMLADLFGSPFEPATDSLRTFNRAYMRLQENARESLRRPDSGGSA